jgi:hypothetical protein
MKRKVISSDLAHIPMFAYLYEDANEDSGNRYSEMQVPGMTSYVAYNPSLDTNMDHDLDNLKENWKDQKDYLYEHDIENPDDPKKMPYDNSMPSNVADNEYSAGFNTKSPAKWHNPNVNTPIFARKVK